MLLLITTGSARGEACEETLGRGIIVVGAAAVRGEGGFIETGFRGVPGESLAGDGMGGNGGDSFRWSVIVRREPDLSSSRSIISASVKSSNLSVSSSSGISLLPDPVLRCPTESPRCLVTTSKSFDPCACASIESGAGGGEVAGGGSAGGSALDGALERRTDVRFEGGNV